MSLILTKDLLPINRPPTVSLEFVDATARDAETYTSFDISRIAALSDGTFWVLKSVGPDVWEEIFLPPGVGPQGPQGFQGAQGNSGGVGAQGSQGTIGSQGTQGSQGSQGSIGTQGSQGATGANGTQGSQGAQGATGSAGSTLGKQSLWVAAGSMSDGTVTATYTASTRTYDFSSTTAQDIVFGFELPKSWDIGTLTFLVRYRQASTSAGGVAWGLKVASHADGDSTTPTYGSQVIVTDTAGTTDINYRTAESSAVTPGNTAAKGDFLTFNLQRVVSDAADTAAVNMQLYGIMLFYTSDALTDA